jgi:hypothetical protein
MHENLCTYYTIGSVKLIFIKKLINFNVYDEETRAEQEEEEE